MSCPGEGRSGFTLIELLIVIAIILILIAIALPNFLEAQMRAKVVRSQGDSRSLGIAITSFQIDQRSMLVDFWDEGDQVALQRLRKWNFCSPLNLADEVRNQRCIFGNLTSPSKYIVSIPDDPFLGTVTDTSNRLVQALAGTYFYGDNDPEIKGNDNNFAALWPGNAERKGLLPLRDGQWALLGMGPDTTAEELGGSEMFRGMPYSPTNGTRSRGDIVTRG
jgi:prepilin-type N-terminal cleavage/methylation domain-containing protein